MYEPEDSDSDWIGHHMFPGNDCGEPRSYGYTGGNTPLYIKPLDAETNPSQGAVHVDTDTRRIAFQVPGTDRFLVIRGRVVDGNRFADDGEEVSLSII
jgi:hypothetical protein